MINIDAIIQDNLKTLKDEQKPPEEVVDKKLEEVAKEAQNTIQQRTKLTGLFEPIQF